MTRGTRVLTLCMLSCLGFACATGGPNLTAPALEELELGNYQRAWSEIQDALASAPEDPELKQLAGKIHVLIRIDTARQKCFRDLPGEALPLLNEVLAEEPDNAAAKEWLTKAKSKLSEQRVREGLELLARGKIQEGRRRFQDALLLWPGNPWARFHLNAVERSLAHKHDNADRHYRRSLEAREQGDLQRVWYHTGASITSEPGHESARRIHLWADRMLASERRERGRELEQDEFWGAAARAYREAERLAREAELDWAAAVGEDAKRMENEMEAMRLFELSSRRLLAGRIEAAKESLEQADKLSMNRALVVAMQARIRLHETEAILAEAIQLKRDQRYAEALERFRVAADRDPGGDAGSYIEQISEILAIAQELFDEACELEKQEKWSEAVDKWQELETVHPRWPDVETRRRQAEQKAGKARKAAQTEGS